MDQTIEKTVDRNNMLENEKITSLLWRLSLPATIAMIVNALYNIVDTIFIGRGIGYLGIGGLTIAFPVQMLIMAVAQMIGIGAASIVSRNLGAKEPEKAKYVVGNAIIVTILLGALISIVGTLFIDPLLILFGATDSLLPYAEEYLQVILIGSLYFPLAVVGNNLIRAEGNAKAAMISMMLGAILNIILDYIFIFPLNMGIRGAALATILSQGATVLYVAFYMYSGKSQLKVKLKHLKPDFSIIRETTTVGLASFARQAAGSIIAILINNLLKQYGGDMGISIYGVVNRVIMFLFMPLFGIVQGMQPIIGYNYGAKRLDRVKEALKLSIIATTILATVSTLFGEIFTRQIIMLFDKNPQLVDGGVMALRIVIAAVPVIGVQVVGAALFQALGKGWPSLILTLSRQVLFFIPLALVLPPYMGMVGIWLAFPLADLASTVFTVILLKKEMMKLDQGAEVAA